MCKGNLLIISLIICIVQNYLNICFCRNSQRTSYRPSSIKYVIRLHPTSRCNFSRSTIS
nr:MAG TPA: hypothetical protein [Caudoviricetes sp.]